MSILGLQASVLLPVIPHSMQVGLSHSKALLQKVITVIIISITMLSKLYSKACYQTVVYPQAVAVLF